MKHLVLQTLEATKTVMYINKQASPNHIKKSGWAT
jgi:hypothetical protein